VEPAPQARKKEKGGEKAARAVGGRKVARRRRTMTAIASDGSGAVPAEGVAGDGGISKASVAVWRGRPSGKWCVESGTGKVDLDGSRRTR
jgi:hypothetical protein